MKRISIILAYILTCCFSSSFGQNLSVTDSTFNNGSNTIPVYVIHWKDNAGKPRQVVMTKPYAPDNYPGVCVFIKYYDQNNHLVNITSPTPNDPWPHNRGFGTTVHHIQTPDAYLDQGTNPTFTLRSQGDHFAIFDLVQTIDGATEYVTYSFFDGLDYFQWQETVQCGGKLDSIMDSRGPYCTMDWDGNGQFDVIDGQEYGAQKYFSQPSFSNNNGAYTLGGNCDIPYVLEWKNNSEVGFVQTQTFAQQLAGAPEFSSKLPLAGTLSTLTSDAWMLDFQMNIYDLQQKITWGMPYGYMEGMPPTGFSLTGTKNGWGQYSLSIVFDALTTAGVKRVMGENRIIQNGNVSLSASIGSVVTSGQVGTKNPATQVLSPAGYDHNYRAWYVQTNGSDQVQVTMNVSSGSLTNPTFRIKNISQIPNNVTFNGNLLTENSDYYASYDGVNNEAWVTLLRNVTGSNTILIQGNTTGITIFSVNVNPSSVSNHSSTNLTFNITASATGTIKNITLDLSSLGGSNLATLSATGGNNYMLNYTLPSGIPTGIKSINVTASDLVNQVHTANITLTITSGIVFGTATVNPSTFVNNAVNPLTFSLSVTDDGSITGVTLDLTSLGGGSSVSMTALGGNNYTFSYSAPAGIASGIKNIPAIATDDQGNTLAINIPVNIQSALIYTAIYTDASSMVCGGCTYGSNGILTQESNNGAYEGVQDFLFNYTVAGYYAGFGLNIANWTPSSAVDFSSYDSLQIALKGPIGAGTGFTVKLSNYSTPSTNVSSSAFQISTKSNYTLVKIPISAFTGVDLTKIYQLDFAVTGAQTGTGHLQVDDIQLIKKFVPTVTEISNINSNLNNVALVRMFPNPTTPSKGFQLEIGEKVSDAIQVEIIDQLGRKLAEQTGTSTAQTLTVHLPISSHGIYSVLITYNGKRVSQRLIVE